MGNKNTPDVRQAADWLTGGGEMGERTRAFDWSQTPVGPVEDWPQSLKTAVFIMLTTQYPMLIWWGKELIHFYNDAYLPVLGKRHPSALGRPAPEVWSEAWPLVGPQADAVMNEGRSYWNEEMLIIMTRNGYPEEVYMTFSYGPMLDNAGKVGGVFCACTEETPRVLSRRRLRTLRALADRASEAKTVEEACEIAAATLAENPHDLPFALLYLLDADGRRLTLAGSLGVERDLPSSPAAVVLSDSEAPWPFLQVSETGKGVEVNLSDKLGPLPGGAWPEPSQRAVVLPMAKPGQRTQLAGVVVAGVSPRLELDEGYRGFISLVADQVATAVANARAYEEEKRRAEALAELDRAKTAFFSNVSHEFRTPLTLMLSPLEDTLAQDGLPPEAREQLTVAHRNSQRLLKLVNTLLDFSRIEAGRIEAVYEPVDLAGATRDLVSVFRSAIERAGMEMIVDCPPLPETVYVDREMWEKIVLNLLSNAFKFTFAGEIAVRLRQAGRAAELTVSDTGTGIPAEELGRLFERFHRVKGARGRSYEGSGIGLALVQELAKLHGGGVSVQSEVDRGSAFTVTIPLGKTHLPADRIGAARTLASTSLRAQTYVEEVLRWLPEPGADKLQFVADQAPGPAWEQRQPEAGATRERILLVDDNADMRDYVRGLLGRNYEVLAVADGEAALAAVSEQAFDLVLADVMMPRLDGFGLLKALRADEGARDIPVILLSARAGEESRVEGLEAGADDYLVKPFSARELRARVEAHLNLQRVRLEAKEALRESEERQSFLLRLSDALRSINDPVKVQEIAARVLGERLRASRAGYAEDYGDGERGAVTRNYTDGVPGIEGVYEYDDYGPELLRAFRDGRTVVRPDIANDPNLTEKEKRAHAALGIAATVNVPLVKGGRLVSILFAHQSEPRAWKASEVALMREVAERTWDAVERARAEEALRINEERMRRQKEAFQAAVNGAALEDSLNIVASVVTTETAGEARTAFYIADPDGLCLHPIWGAGDMPESYTKQVDGFVIGEGSLACGLAVPTGRPVLTRDVFEEPLWKSWVYLAEEYDFRGCWSFPIKTRDNKPVGTFAMYFRAAREATPRDLALADVVTQTAAVIISSHSEAVERARAEEALRRAHDELEQKVLERTHELGKANVQLQAEVAERRQAEATRSEALQRLVTAQEDERRRISRELHDILGQYLTALQVGLQTLKELNGCPPDVTEGVTKMRAVTLKMDEEVERLSLELRPLALDDLGLEDALRRHVQEWAASSGIAVDLHAKNLDRQRLPAYIESTVYRVVQEALTNVRRHAEATRVSLIVERRRKELIAIIEDDGRGFDLETVRGSAGGQRKFGLLGMRERAALAGGRFDVETAPGSGATLYLHIPIDFD